MAKPWTNQQTNYLLVGTAACGMVWVQDHTKPNKRKKVRSVNALRCKAYKMGLMGLNAGLGSLHDIEESTGYSKTQLLRARKALRQKWKRSSAAGNYLITVFQIEELLDWLKDDYWCTSKKLYNCVYCGSNKEKHVSFGLCKACLKTYRKIYKNCDKVLLKKIAKKILRGTNKELCAISRRIKRNIAISEAQLIKIKGEGDANGSV